MKSSSSEQGQTRWNTIRKINGVLLWLSLILFCFFYRDEITVDQIVNLSPKNQGVAVCVLLLLFAFKSVTFFIYGGILYAASGVLFPLPVAIALNTVGTIVMASIPYFIGKKTGAAMLDRLTEKYQKLALLKSLQNHNEFFISFFMRIVGLLPGDLVSMYLGASGIRYMKYISGSLCGLASAIITFSVMGMSIEDPSSALFLISAGVEAGMMLLSLILFLLWNRRKRKASRE